MNCRSAVELVWGVELAAEPGVFAIANLEKCNYERGELAPREWSLEKQAYCCYQFLGPHTKTKRKY
jgi:hypothetical protein